MFVRKRARPAHEHLGEEVLLRREVVVQRAERDVGRFGDVLHLDLVEVALAEEREAGVDDPVAPRLLRSGERSSWRPASPVTILESDSSYCSASQEDSVSIATDQRYTIISSDTHAGGSHAQYREFLEKKYLDDFDAWRGKYKNPFKDLGDERALRNWDNEMRNGQQDADGIVGEVIFPNTVPPFFPSFVLFAAPPKPDEYEHRLAGVRAHNRWLEDFCGQFPRAPRRHRSVLRERHRRRDRRRQVDQGARPARRRAAAVGAARRHVAEAAEPPRLRPAVGRVRRPRGPAQLPRRRRRSVVPARTRRRR